MNLNKQTLPKAKAQLQMQCDSFLAGGEQRKSFFSTWGKRTVTYALIHILCTGTPEEVAQVYEYISRIPDYDDNAKGYYALMIFSGDWHNCNTENPITGYTIDSNTPITLSSLKEGLSMIKSLPQQLIYAGTPSFSGGIAVRRSIIRTIINCGFKLAIKAEEFDDILSEEEKELFIIEKQERYFILSSSEPIPFNIP